ncbi:thaumatin-like protein [Solanum lycopersicum]|uniref:Thaumatin-like protein n=1 Tax=Solanum lycopersicum TaxID=4081 RepID=A0A3Q7FWD7_SOLLC|nr:thaumatin-like protein [Solanum lycopersicum]
MQITMNFSRISFALQLFFICHFITSGKLREVEGCSIYISNKCPFPIWPATAPNTGHPVLSNGGFYLPSGGVRRIGAPGDWSGRIWARTGCNFNVPTNHKPACETGDCDGKLECEGTIGLPPATLVEMTIQYDKKQPSFYDVSLVDGYNLPVSVTNKPSSTKCLIRGCTKNLKDTCPPELQVVNDGGQVVACKSACLAFNLDSFCCRNKYGSPEKCKPSVYSSLFKNACPSYVSYAFDTPSPVLSCSSDQFIITFCPDKWATHHLSASSII